MESISQNNEPAANERVSSYELAELLVQALRDLVETRRERDAFREMITVAIETISTQARQIQRDQQVKISLREQLRGQRSRAA